MLSKDYVLNALAYRRDSEALNMVATDVELLYAIAKKDESALQELQRRHSSLVYKVIAHWLTKGCTNPSDHGQDAGQETWDRVWKHAARFDEDKGTLEAWVSTIAKRRALTHLVRCLKQKEQEVQLSESSKLPASSWAMTYDLPQVIQELELVDNVLGSLNSEHRAIVQLGLFERIPYGEISAELSVSVTKIKQVIYRFKQACRESGKERG